MAVSIALPTFLLDKEYHNSILIIYLLAMVIVIPCKYHKSTAVANCRVYVPSIWTIPLVSPV